MHVRSKMSKSLVTITKNTTIAEALELMRGNSIRRLPVLENEKLVGIVTDRDLSEVSPSPATSLSVFEINYLLAKMSIGDVLPKNQKVLTIDEEAYIEEAALIMRENKISGLPVLSKGKLVGIITETDIFEAFIELLGVREIGSRLTLEVIDYPGVLANVTSAITEHGDNILRVAVFREEEKVYITIKLTTEDIESLVSFLQGKGFTVHAFKSYRE